VNYESGIMNHDKESFNVLFIGRLEKRKNLVNLIKAFEVLNSKFPEQKNSQPKAGPPRAEKFKLTLVGKEGFGFEEIKKVVQKSPHKNDIILKGYISEQEKEKLYQDANIFILPSFYEGFGLPILEAMSYGLPVICSNTSSLPEIAGDAALLIDPNNPKEIAEAINKVFSDNNFKKEMIKKGFENVKRFSWEKCVKETLDALLHC
jgi:glycosyltransferase involved in cell wall biosynthesis